MRENSQTETFKTSDGCSIEFTVDPSRDRAAQWIVLIHSLGLDRSIWDGVVATLDGQVETLACDCRGHGNPIGVLNLSR
jgi:pimeloyl-ACP methyl ester carboxylesterase